MSGRETSRVAPAAAVLLLALISQLMSILPPLLAYAVSSPPEKVFMGFRYMPEDHYQYAAFVRQASDSGRFFLENQFTDEPQRPSFLLLYFWMLGRVVRITGLAVPLAWELFGRVGGVLYVLAFWRLTRFYFAEERRRLIATILFSLAGGVEWMVTLMRATIAPWAKVLEYPSDYFWNWSTFGTMVVPPWIWPALTLTLACHGLLSGTSLGLLLPALLLPITWFLHPYSGMVAYLTFGLLPIVPALIAFSRAESPDWDRVRANLRRALPGLLSFSVVAAYLLWARSDQVFNESSAGGLWWKEHDSVWWYLPAYGALLPLAWFGLRESARDDDLRAHVVLSWLGAAFFLSVNPIYAGVKFQYLMFPPLVVLAAKGLFCLKDHVQGFRRALGGRIVKAVCVALLFLDMPVVLVKELSSTASAEGIFMPAAEIGAMKWLDAQPPGVVLSGPWAGNRIPWLAGKKVFVGHWFLTPGFENKAKSMALLLHPQVPLETKLEVLRATSARYVYVGTKEAGLGRIDPALPLKPIYEVGGVTIYEVGR